MSTHDHDVLLQARRSSLESLSDNVASLWVTPIAILEHPPSALEFARDFVAASRPVVICNAMLDNKGQPLRLSLNDLLSDHGSLEITVDVTPDGHGDCLRRVGDQRLFVAPEERRMGLDAFVNLLRQSTRPTVSYRDCVFHDTNTEFRGQAAVSPQPVVYYSRQNDCLRDEWTNLWESRLFPSTIDWAEQGFGTGPPDAVNLWIGNASASSSMHKDHYENLFYVLEGCKMFTLCPPADAPFLYERSVNSGRFVWDGDDWKVQRDIDDDGQPTRVQWVNANVLDPDLDEFPLLKYTHPMTVKVEAGSMLYLPALWFHHVTQKDETIGLNYWYDMRFDARWCYFQFLQELEPQPLD